MDWVKAEDARSLKILEADPLYASFYADALKIAVAPDRLPEPEQRGSEIYNFWRDASHVDGIYRKTSLADYLTANPTWKTVIDYDALSKQDNVKWVSKGPQLPLSRRPSLPRLALRRWRRRRHPA